MRKRGGKGRGKESEKLSQNYRKEKKKGVGSSKMRE